MVKEAKFSPLSGNLAFCGKITLLKKIHEEVYCDKRGNVFLLKINSPRLKTNKF